MIVVILVFSLPDDAEDWLERRSLAAISYTHR